ncbi:MAG: hypothetical protein HY820_30520 [Acidobacteria bacterium]|nr:hypothetical protein [Acidobacteriota bacterium]
MNSSHHNPGPWMACHRPLRQVCARLVSVLMLAVILGNPLMAGYALLSGKEASCAMACCKRDKGHCARTKSHGHEASLQATEGCGAKCVQSSVVESTKFFASEATASIAVIVPSLALPARDRESLTHSTSAQTPRLPRPPPSA